MDHSFLRKFLYTGLVLAFAFISEMPVRCQDGRPFSSYEESLRMFEEGQFRMALEGFRILKESQPANVLPYYYSGRCLVELNEDLDEAIELLYGASRRGAPDDAYFYLGRAYHLDYNFSEASKNYSKFEQLATRQQEKDLRVAHMIQTCSSALKITATYNQYEVMAVTFLDLSDSASFSQIRMKGGQMQRKPMAFFKVGEDRSGLGSLMFMPASPQRGDYIYYSGPGRGDKEGMQLYRVKKGTARAWSDPVEIKALNTEGDELLPYYDPIENDLYYASNGGLGVGGFDLYRAHFDAERDEWTAPINLGFPINSAMDDYLLLPGSDLGMMMFFSNRQGTDSTLTVYRVHMVEPKLHTDPNDNRKLNQIASLGGAANKLLAEMGAMSAQASQEKDFAEEKDLNDPGSLTSQVYTPVKILPSEGEPLAKAPDNENLLTEARMHQSTSDSLLDLAGDARAKVRESDDPNDRWVWQKQIMLWEKRSHDEALKAAALYASIEEGRSVKQIPPAVNSPEAAALVAIAASVPGEPGSQPETGPVSGSGDEAYISRFDILGAAPYSESNPVPTDVALPDGAFYRIQLGAYGSAVSPEAFGGISPITAETLKERGLIKYYAGKFTKYEDASLALQRVRSAGFEDAFVSAWYNGKPVSIQKARELE